MKSAHKFPDFNPEVSRLRRQVRELLDAARHNERIHNRFQTIELALLAAQDFYAIAAYLQDEFRSLVKLDMVSLVLIDECNEISSALCAHGKHECPQGIKLVKDASAGRFLAALGNKPKLCQYQPDEHDWLFEQSDLIRGSMAILPFVRREKTIGCLALYSKESERYQTSAATELLQRLGAVTAICIENCLNYVHLRRLGMTDALTGLANRRELEKRLGIEVSRSLRESVPLSCLYLDIDHFKQVNDNHGHDVGDVVLQKVAGIMLEAVRMGDIVARIGGEEFVVVLPGLTGVPALLTAERIRKAVENSSVEIDAEQSLKITISVGLASFVAQQNSIGDSAEIGEEILIRADQALFQAKAQGRNRVIVAVD